MRGGLANDAQLALEMKNVCDARAAPDKELTDHRLCRDRRLSECGIIRWNVAPPEERLTFFGDDFFKEGLADLALRRIPRQKGHAGSIHPSVRQSQPLFRTFAR